MRKAICAAITAVIIVCMSLPVFAAYSSISVKNNDTSSTPVTYSYDAASSGEIVKSIKPLMTKLEDLNRLPSVVQTLTITSLSADAVPVSFRLRLSLPDGDSQEVQPQKLQTPTPEQYSALDYYNIKVTTASGEVLYDDGAEDTPERGEKNYKDINLGTMNTAESAENRIINLTISVNKDLKTAAVETALRKLDWSIVSDTYGQNNTVSENDNEEEKTTESADEPEQTDEAAVKPTSKPSPSPSSEVNEQTSTVTLNSGEYVAGQDIYPGRYKMTGQGKVHVYTPEGVLKTTIALKPKGDSSTNGIDEYVITLSDGETVDVENKIMLSPHRAQSILPTAAPSASPAQSGGSNQQTNSSSSSSASSKSNPKTGDSTPVVLVSAIGIAALLGAGAIAYKKRRMNK